MHRLFGMHGSGPKRVPEAQDFTNLQKQLVNRILRNTITTNVVKESDVVAYRAGLDIAYRFNETDIGTFAAQGAQRLV